MHSVVIVGASGYAGAELLRLCLGHPGLEVVGATGASQAGEPIAALYPNLVGAVGDRRFDRVDDLDLAAADLVFLALPHGESQSLVAERGAGLARIVDLAADFRLDDAALYPTWYGEDHAAPDLLDTFVFGQPELFRDDLRGATRIAVPGCYPTTGMLALAPLLRAGLVEPTGLIVDAASGVSGAGRPPKPHTTFCAVDEDFTAYGLLTHRHTPEMEQALTRVGGTDVQVLFTPHLAPMNRGILATCYARPTTALTQGQLDALYHDAYAAEPFVTVVDGSPSTKATAGSNSVHVAVHLDQRTGTVVALAALDNLVKGAAGQAVQCANLSLGLDEPTGLPATGLYP
ncbi:MAG: N-acetyl-gamma-glutamyl-phosphate reductase [Acidimicrobiales bacterium]|nr:N-acetyl-gamma-glutamyl-phosphate reductase [Acidimicrobiales bacterium]